MQKIHRNKSQRNRKKSVAMATLVARFAEKLIRPKSKGVAMESKEIKYLLAHETEKKCCHGNTCYQVLPKN